MSNTNNVSHKFSSDFTTDTMVSIELDPRIIVWSPTDSQKPKIFTLAYGVRDAEEIAVGNGWVDGVIYHIHPFGTIEIPNSDIQLKETFNS